MLNKNIRILVGDITDDAILNLGDAVVLPSNPMMRYGSGVSGAIFEKAGIDVLEEYAMRKYGISYDYDTRANEMKVGDVRVTPGFGVPCDIIWVQGPRRWDYDETSYEVAENLLIYTYARLLQYAYDEKYNSILLPSLGTGSYGFEHEEVAPKVINVINTFLENHNSGMSGHDMKVYLVLREVETASYYRKELEDYDRDSNGLCNIRQRNSSETYSLEKCAYEICKGREYGRDTCKIGILPHAGQIPTYYEVIQEELITTGQRAINSILTSFLYDRSSSEYLNHLVMAAVCLEKISCLIYYREDTHGKNGKYVKPEDKIYAKEIFESFAETVPEVYDRLSKYGVSEAWAERIHTMIWQISDIVCPMMACIDEQAFVSEYVYAIDYVRAHDGNLQKPDMVGLFPRNYPDYRYTEGIARVVNEYDGIGIKKPCIKENWTASAMQNSKPGVITMLNIDKFIDDIMEDAYPDN